MLLLLLRQHLAENPSVNSQTHRDAQPAPETHNRSPAGLTGSVLRQTDRPSGDKQQAGRGGGDACLETIKDYVEIGHYLSHSCVEVRCGYIYTSVYGCMGTLYISLDVYVYVYDAYVHTDTLYLHICILCSYIFFSSYELHAL